MSKVPLTLLVLILFMASKRMDSASLRLDDANDDDSDWNELFGHLSASSTLTTRESELITAMDEEKEIPVSLTVETSTVPSIVPPIPAALPFIFDPDSKDNKLPNIGANTHGNMEGIAISQNRGISLGIYMVSSSYNHFNTVFGNSNITKSFNVRGWTGQKQIPVIHVHKIVSNQKL